MKIWPFNRKKKEPEPEIDDTPLLISRLKDFRDIGEKFSYLGVDMIVTGHAETRVYPWGVDILPMLTCDYRDQSGKIQSIAFSVRKLPVLMAENI